MTDKNLALVLLPEIYGCNTFMNDIKTIYQQRGVTVFCPNLWLRAPFPYEKQQQAYDYFRQHLGFKIYKDIDYLLEELQAAYDRVIVLGFSVGATLAWRCSALGHTDGIIACYGSRIRDYLDIEPRCSTLLLFAKYDSFDVTAITKVLRQKKNVQTKIFPAQHGFFDLHGKTGNAFQAKAGWNCIDKFIQYICEK